MTALAASDGTAQVHHGSLSSLHLGQEAVQDSRDQAALHTIRLDHHKGRLLQVQQRGS